MQFNKLKDEKSPYLLQHSQNPVNWYAWNEESLRFAKEQDRPIFLSVGYSTCYWCHVMERESFEDEKIANLLNNYFINIKVDREERPDLDRVYMTALQSMVGSGGWPMNMFLTPDLKPFYGATYIPPKEKYGRTGFEDIIEQINILWTTKRNEIVSSSERIYKILNDRITNKNSSTDSNIIIDNRLFEKSFESIKNIFDYDNGGFGFGNKFPRPVVLNYLLSLYYKDNNIEALDMVTYTLKKMCEGGIYDHLGGGFHRYSVDMYWRVPHFEKMLYDQAQISNILFDAYSITKKDFYLEYAIKTLDYVLNNMSDKNGGFYSAEDAESSVEESIPKYKEEGYFYTWTKSQIEDILGKEDSSIFCYAYGIKYEGNTINDPHNIFKNKNVLHILSDDFDTAKRFNKNPEEIRSIIDNCKNILLNKRDKRPKPHLDDKILTSWNCLMASAFAKGYKVTGNDIYKEKAILNCSFVLKNMWNEKENTLSHRFRDGDVKYKSILDDYAFLIKALLDLYEITFDVKYISKAIKITDTTIEKFYDKENSGFFDTEQTAADIILKTKDIYDGAEPSGNSIMMENLIRLGFITDDNKFKDIADKSITYFYPEIENSHFSSPQILNNIIFSLKNPVEIIFSGNLEDNNLKEMIEYINSKFLPFKILIHSDKEIEKYSSIVKKIVKDYKQTRIYVCENQSCKLPVDNIKDLKKLI
jgi:uncharacterized protein